MIKLTVVGFITSIIVGLLFQTNYNVEPVLAGMKHNYQQLKKNVQVQKELEAYNSQDQWGRLTMTAVRLAKREDYPVNILLAQAALESDHGRSKFCRERYNCFGINAVDWNPNQATGYKNLEEGIMGYIQLIKKHYPQAYAHRDEPETMISLIKAGGYASDPQYIYKVMSQPEFYKFTN